VTLFLSAFFSASETALFTFQPHELGRMKASHGPDRLVALLRSRPKRLLITLLFANMAANVVFFSVSYLLTLTLAPRIGRVQAVLLDGAALLTVVTFGEVIPKNLAVSFYRLIGRAAAVPLWYLQAVCLPVVAPLERLAEAMASLAGPGEGKSIRPDELEMLVRLGAQEGVLDSGTGQMIAEVIGLSGVRIREVMVPRVDMPAFDLQDAPERLLPLMRGMRLSAVPIYDGRMDNMLGLIRVRDALFRRPGQALRELVRPVPFLPETTTVEEALLCCQREHSNAAFVVDEYGAVVGLVELGDLVEEVVGEIADEYDVQKRPPVDVLGGGRYRLDGRLSLRTWQELSGLPIPEMGVNTVGGLVMALLGKVPEVGDRVKLGGQEFVVEAVQGRRASWVLASVSAAEGEEHA
jgi:CBS domain containing-hemolysin-like protein